ncbi:MAG: NUDIX domain-containing protein, partial [Parcubacteria group bacterium]|nr:NUDIX domain-containing protein [Parcubacteria group bacterium]
GEVLVVNQRSNSWSLPKGHIDKGETPLEAAQREIYEESGIQQLFYIKKLGSYKRYHIGKDPRHDDKTELKNITIFLFKTKEKILKPRDPHNPEARWVRKKNVAKLLTHPKDKAFFKKIRRTIA